MEKQGENQVVKLESLKTLKIEEGEYLVVKASEYLSAEMHNRILKTLKTVIGEKVERVLILDCGIDLYKIKFSETNK